MFDATQPSRAHGNQIGLELVRKLQRRCDGVLVHEVELGLHALLLCRSMLMEL